MLKSLVRTAILFTVIALVSACGTSTTIVSREDTSIPSSPTGGLPTFTVEPSDTHIPPTSTPVPLTATSTPTPMETATPLPTSIPTPTIQPYEVITGLSYMGGQDPDRSLSIYLPTTRRQSLTLLVLGGEYYPSMLRYFADLGYTVIAYNARSDTYQQFIQDGFCALAWAHAKADRYGFDAAGIIPVGGSMGGGIAALLGLIDDPTPFLEECPHTLPETDRVRAVITQAGVFDYTEEGDFFEGYIESISGFMGGTAEQVPENWAAASAITWVKGDEPPFLLVHGEADTNVAPHQSEKFASALEEAGVDVELVLLLGINHYTSVTDRRVFEAMASYLARLQEAD